MWRVGCIVLWIALLSRGALAVEGQFSKGIHNSDDLHTFISRPDLKPPKFHVQTLHPRKIAPGYWFVAPYEDLLRRQFSKMYLPAQIGPHIYDGTGELVWSGAHLFEEATTFDFKTSTYMGSPSMTFILRSNEYRAKSPEGGGVILDSSMKIQTVLLQAAENPAPNMHEFTITAQGAALMITEESRHESVTENFTLSASSEGVYTVFIADTGFREMNINTGQSLFEWRALDHVSPSESFAKRPSLLGYTGSRAWDWFHLNSIDKSQEGDYLISARYTNAIYKISREDGAIIWQLGGRHSSFELLDSFNFSAQHDARFVSENSTHTVISFFNNAANDFEETAEASSAVKVCLDLQSMTATLMTAFERPDHKLTRLRGNAQSLPNGNTFVSWSENSIISEFDPQGTLLLQAAFKSNRFVTYRAYKSSIVLQPSEPIAVKSFVYSTDEPRDANITAIYVSWNGATEVAFWRIYAWHPGKKHTLIGETARQGFETVLMSSGIWCKVYVEAISGQRTVLGKSKVYTSVLPPSWRNSSSYPALDSDGSFGKSKINKLHASPENLLSPSTHIKFLLTCCIFVLLVLLALAAWKIQQLKRQLHGGQAYRYTLLDKR